jgi:hypothetical protein
MIAMKYLIYLFALTTMVACGTGTKTKESIDDNGRSENHPDPWLSEESWPNGSRPFAFSQPRNEWSADQKMIHEAIYFTSYEFVPLYYDEVIRMNIVSSQKECDNIIKDAMEGRSLEREEDVQAGLDLKYTTNRFRDQILAEPHLLPETENREWYFDDKNAKEVCRFLDLLFHCNVEGPVLHRIPSIKVNGTSAEAIVEGRGGKLVSNDTLINGKEFGIPEFHGGFCPSVRFDLVKEDGKWLIDHREVLN